MWGVATQRDAQVTCWRIARLTLTQCPAGVPRINPTSAKPRPARRSP